jgi:hypothetical protein
VEFLQQENERRQKREAAMDEEMIAYASHTQFPPKASIPEKDPPLQSNESPSPNKKRPTMTSPLQTLKRQKSSEKKVAASLSSAGKMRSTIDSKWLDSPPPSVTNNLNNKWLDKKLPRSSSGSSSCSHNKPASTLAGATTTTSVSFSPSPGRTSRHDNTNCSKEVFSKPAAFSKPSKGYESSDSSEEEDLLATFRENQKRANGNAAKNDDDENDDSNKTKTSKRASIDQMDKDEDDYSSSLDQEATPAEKKKRASLLDKSLMEDSSSEEEEEERKKRPVKRKSGSPHNPIALMRQQQEYARQQNNENAPPPPNAAGAPSLWSDSEDERKQDPLQDSDDDSSPKKKRKSKKKRRSKSFDERAASTSHEHIYSSGLGNNDEGTRQLLRLDDETLAKTLHPEQADPRFGPFALESLVLTDDDGNSGHDDHQVPAALNRYLLPYQREGIQFMHQALIDKRGVILGDGTITYSTFVCVICCAALFNILHAVFINFCSFTFCQYTIGRYGTRKGTIAGRSEFVVFEQRLQTPHMFCFQIVSFFSDRHFKHYACCAPCLKRRALVWTSGSLIDDES